MNLVEEFEKVIRKEEVRRVQMSIWQKSCLGRIMGSLKISI